MLLNTFDLEQWKALHPQRKKQAALQLIQYLPAGFEFNRLDFCSLGTQSHTVVFFDWRPSLDQFPEAAWCYGQFALVPGGTVTLGYDREHPWQPTPAQMESWNDTQEEYGVPDLPEFLNDAMTPLRTLQMAPFLMELTRIEARVSPSDASLFPLLTDAHWLTQNQFIEAILPKMESEGLIVSCDSKFSGDVVKQSRKYGFRSPFSDEWEWACAAGSRTIWRWGDDCPTNGYPNHYSEYHPDWDLHERPNAFGLTIAHDDYEADYCEDGIVRGGDGGGTTCGGAGFLDAWLLLASARFDLCEGRDRGRATRRVFPLEQVLS